MKRNNNSSQKSGKQKITESKKNGKKKKVIKKPIKKITNSLQQVNSEFDLNKIILIQRAFRKWEQRKIEKQDLQNNKIRNIFSENIESVSKDQSEKKICKVMQKHSQFIPNEDISNVIKFQKATDDILDSYEEKNSYEVQEGSKPKLIRKSSNNRLNPIEEYQKELDDVYHETNEINEEDKISDKNLLDEKFDEKEFDEKCQDKNENANANENENENENENANEKENENENINENENNKENVNQENKENFQMHDKEDTIEYEAKNDEIKEVELHRTLNENSIENIPILKSRKKKENSQISDPAISIQNFLKFLVESDKEIAKYSNRSIPDEKFQNEIKNSMIKYETQISSVKNRKKELEEKNRCEK